MARSFPLILLLVASFTPLGYSEDWEWKDYARYWCRPQGRSLLARNVPADQCQSFCDDSCVAVEWWEGGSNACYICTDITLLMRFGIDTDKSYPPHVFIKEQPGGGVLPTTAPESVATTQKATTTAYDEGIPTTSPEDATAINEGTALPTPEAPEEPTTAPVPEVTATTAPEVTATTSAPEVGATSSASEKASTSSAPEVSATSSAPEMTATSSTLEEASTSSAPEVAATTSAPEEAATTSAPEEASTSSAPEVAATTSAPEEAATTSAPEEAKTSSAPEEASTSSAPEVAATSSAPEEASTSSAPEVPATSSPPEVAATSSAPEEAATSSAPEEASTTSAPEEASTSSAPEEASTSSAPEEASTSSAPEVAATSSAPEVAATSSAPEEASTSSAPEVPATSSPPEVAATSSAPEEAATSSAPEKATASPEPATVSTETVPSMPSSNLPSPPWNICTRYHSENSLEVYWETPLQPHGEILSYTIKIFDASGAFIQSVQVPGNVYAFEVDSLQPGTEYGFELSADNQHGRGTWSERVSAETDPVVGRIDPTDEDDDAEEEEEPYLELSHGSDFVVSGMDKSTRAICYVRGQEFLGWYKSSGEQITGKNSSERMYIETEEDSHSLVIQSLKLSDGGIYVCRGSVTKAAYKLYVEFSVVDPPAKQILEVGKKGVIYVGVMVGYPEPDYFWKKDGRKFDPNSGRFSLQRDGSIDISDVKASDDGRYMVRISQLNRRRETNEWIEVVVIDPPQFIETPEPRTRNLTEGYPASFECSASGIPPPEITWTGPDGKQVSKSDKRLSIESDGMLKLAEVELTDVGTWTCEAKSSVGNVSVQVEVQTIYVPPQIEPVKDITASEGDDASLNCSASGFPLPNVVWIKDNREYPGQKKTPGFSSITFQKLGLEDISLFTCEASNVATNEEGEVIVRSADANLYVMVEPRPYDEVLTKEPVYSGLGSPAPVTFGCAFTGYPPPEVWIEKDDIKVATGFESVIFNITTDSADDYGTYYCKAENVVKPSSKSYSLEIRRPEYPHFSLKPVLPSRKPTVGFPVSLTWAVSGIPKPEVRWKSASGKYINSDDPRFSMSEGNLTIKTLQEVDTGMWTIEAANLLGTEKVSILFEIVYVAPKIAPISDLVVSEGEDAVLRCSATGVPTPVAVWIQDGKEFAGQTKSLGESVIEVKDPGLDDNSEFTCEARNGAEDEDGQELYDSTSIKLIVKVEPRPVSSTLTGPAIPSYIGNPKPTVMTCAFSGFPPPEVKFVKDGAVLARSKEYLSYSVTVDGEEDFGVYVCTAENEVKASSANYTFEIEAADPPSSPQDVTFQSTCDTVILNWASPKTDGGFPVIEYVITYGDTIIKVSSDATRRVIENLNHSNKYSIEIRARSEAELGEAANVEGKTSQFCQILSCVGMEHDDDVVYTLNASQGRWPNDGFCRALSEHATVDTKTYEISVNFYVPNSKKASTANYLGVLFNAEDNSNFEFIFFRIGEITGPCFQTGEIQNNRLNWYGSEIGSCPQGPPRRGQWIHVKVVVRDSDVSIFLDGVFVTMFKGHFPAKGFGGLLVANHEGNVVRFKDFKLSGLDALPFQTKSCASAQQNEEFFSLISQPDLKPRDVCRAFFDESEAQESSSYEVSVDLYSEAGWSGDNTAFLGIMFNARDINNADFIYFRPFWKDHCYQTGYLMGGRQMREGSRTGPCSCTVRGEKWFNVRLEVRGNAVIIFMDNKPAATFKSHFPASIKGSGVLVTGGCRKSIRFRNFKISPLASLPFATKNCQSAMAWGIADYYKLMAYGGLRDSAQPGICRALFPKVIEGNSYVIRVNFFTEGSLLGGQYGVIFNVKNTDSFEFVYFRPYQRERCVQAGYLRGTKMREFESKSSSCAYGFMRGGSRYNIRVKVNESEVKVYIDDVEVSVFRSQFPVNGRGGVMVASGFKRKIIFKDFQISA